MMHQRAQYAPRRAMFGVRVFLGVVGVIVIAVGLYEGIKSIPAEDYGGIVVWLVAAIIIHDGILAPLTALIASFSRPFASFMGVRLAAIARASFVVAACATLIAIPGIIAQIQGPRNETIHTSNYVLTLAVVWLVAIGVAGIAIAIARLRATRR